MLVLEAKLKGQKQQFSALDEAVRTANFIRNKAIRYWQDNKGTSKKELSALCAVLAKEFEWAKKLNSMARQASAERAWFSISRFYANCKLGRPGKKGFPKFKKQGRSVEYKTSGWKLSEDRKTITFTDGFEAGTFKLKGTRDLSLYALAQIKRVRVVRRADGYHVQFCLDVERSEQHAYNGSMVGIDLGLESFYTDSEGVQVENPKLLRKSEKALKRLQRRLAKKKKGSINRKKAIQRMALKHLKVSRQRKDFAVKMARTLIQSNDLVVYEKLQVRNMVKNHHLAKSISDVSWGQFTQWVDYFGKLHQIQVIVVAPQYTSQDCPGCNARVQKALSTRTHQCACGLRLHRDHAAAINILNKGLNTLGHREFQACGEQTSFGLSKSLVQKVSSMCPAAVREKQESSSLRELRL
jgi:putative transposase